MPATPQLERAGLAASSDTLQQVTARADGSHYDYYGVYDDELLRTPDGWRIVARKQYPFYTEGEVAPNPQ